MEFNKYASFEELDKDAFSSLVKSGFGKKLLDDYFDYCNPEYIIVGEEEGKYHGGIVVESIGSGVHYLDKIVVSAEYQNSGLGKKLWKLMNGDSEKLVWRAKEDNNITDFYVKQCEGLQKCSPWIIYWYGLNSSELEKGINYAISKKKTLEELK